MANGLSSLSSPLVVLGGQYWIGSNRTEFTGGMSGMDILAGGFGASSAQWAGEQLQGVVGGTTLSDNLSQALVGALLSNYGGAVPRNKAMARGIHMNVAQQAFSEAGFAAGDLLGDVTGSLGGAGASTGGGGSASSEPENSPSSNGQVMDGSVVTL